VHIDTNYEIPSGKTGTRTFPQTMLQTFSRTFSTSAAKALRRKASAALGALALLTGITFASQSMPGQVTSVVASSQVNLTPSGSLGSGQAVVDACGDIYINQAGTPAGLVEVQAGTGKITLISPNTNGYNGAPGLAIDSTKSNLYMQTGAQYYGDNFSVFPITNCVVGAGSNFPTNLGNAAIYYYGNANAIAVDGAGDVFFAPSQASNGEIIEESAAATPSIAQASWPNAITSLAADSSGNVYFTDGSTNVYILPAPVAPSTTYGAATVFASGFKTPVGLAFDPEGNLYVGDSGASLIDEIPLVAGKTTTALSVADQFAVANVAPTTTFAVDAQQRIYLGNGSVIQVNLGSAALPGTTLGQTSAATSVNYVFNAAVTPSAITLQSGTAASTNFANTSASTCQSNNAYTAGMSCSVSVAYTPSAVGQQTGTLVLAANGAALNTATLSGVGLGPAITIDPGLISSIGSGFTAPESVTLDGSGNIYVADASTNTVTEFLAGSTTGTPIATSTYTLKAPGGIAVDASGDVFISDTGNNRIVEVPVVSGALVSANTVLLTAGLNAPEGLAFDGAGNLYIADTGNKRLVFIANNNGSLQFSNPQAFSTGLSAPSAVTIDASGNIYLADSGNNNVLRFTLPINGLQPVTVVSGLSAPSALATDASGSLFVVDKGNSAVDRYPNVNGNLGTKTLVSSGIASPFGVATDAFGNLYITDNVAAVVDQVARVQSSLNFGGWNINTTSTPLTATVESAGNASATFGSPSYTIGGSASAGFSITSDTCAGSTVTTGNSCAITAAFTPPVTELNAQENLTLSGGAGNGTPSIALIGTGANLQSSTLSLALTSPASGTALSVGESVTFTATIGTGTDTTTPGGNVKFFVNGGQVGTVNVVSGAASLTLPNGLPNGNPVTITATYSGDVINYTGSTVTITEIVAALPTTLTLAVDTPFTNPNSVTDVGTNPAGPSVPLIATLGITGSIIPGGSVTFYSGSSVLGVTSVSGIGGGVYQAQLDTTALRAGTTNVVENNSYLSTYNIHAVYSGDTSYSGSTSNSESISVVAPPNPLPACASPASMTITSTSMTAGVATYGYTLTSGSAPAMGQSVTITNTTNGSGVFNVSGYTIASVAATNATTGTFTVTAFNTALNYASAAESGTATVAQTCAGTGATFTISPSNPSISVPAVSTGTSTGSTTLTITSYGGWQGVLNFTCTGLPTFATCAPYPGSTIVTVSTAAAPLAQTQVTFIINTNLTPIVPTASMSWWISGIFGMILLFSRRRLKRLGHQQLFTFAAIGLLLTSSILGMAGCSTGGPSSVTPAATTTVTVTVHASQLLPNTTNGSTYLPDVNVGTFQLALTVK
jgi:sugar lactone lactonase YvrE